MKFLKGYEYSTIDLVLDDIVNSKFPVGGYTYTENNHSRWSTIVKLQKSYWRNTPDLIIKIDGLFVYKGAAPMTIDERDAISNKIWDWKSYHGYIA